MHVSDRSRVRRYGPAVAAALVAALGLTGCAAPVDRYVSSTSDDIVIKLPRAWSVIRSGDPNPINGTPPPSGSWIGVFDADSHPAVSHIQASLLEHPVAVARTWVVTKEEAAALTDDALRDILVPVSSAGRAAAQATGTLKGTFATHLSEPFTSNQAKGVHEVFSYALTGGTEVYNQIAVVDRTRTRVHLLVVHCNQACYRANEPLIDETVDSFTVKAP